MSKRKPCRFCKGQRTERSLWIHVCLFCWNTGFEDEFYSRGQSERKARP